MANGLFAKAREGYLAGNYDFDADDIRALLIRSSGGGSGPYYTVNLNTHDFLDDVPNNADCRPVAAVAIGSRTTTNGVADGADITFSSVPAGDAVQGILIYHHTGVEGTSELIAWVDTGTGLPVTPNGGDITIQWNASGIFAL